jgi:hypothetical protein
MGAQRAIGDRLNHYKGTSRNGFISSNLPSAVLIGTYVAATLRSSSVTSLGEGLRQVSRDTADSRHRTDHPIPEPGATQIP